MLHLQRRIASFLLVRAVDQQLTSSSTTTALKFGKRCASVDYTWKTYGVERRTDLSEITDADIAYFQQLLPDRVVTDEDELQINNKDWLNMVRGMSCVMLRPKTTAEVSQILQYCNGRKIPVCPQGGNTGLVGGSVPVFDEVILSMSLMNKIHEIDSTAGTVVCQSGVVLEQLDNALADHGLMMPLDLGSKGSCHIGGNVSTNAGDIRYLRYGSFHGNVLGVEAVLADGTILDCLSTLKKDNTGYDLKQLFIGSEGTLGVVTQVSLLAPTRPQAVNVSFFGVNSYEDLMKTFGKAKMLLSEILSAFEFMDSEAMKSVTSNLKLKNPIGDFPFYVLVETSGSNGDHDAQKLDAFLEDILESGVASDGTMATEPSKIQEIWKLRESCAPALLQDGEDCYKYDISLSVDSMYEIVDRMREQFGDRTNRIAGYGHFGDGNLHLTLVAPTRNKELKQEIEMAVFQYTGDQGGSISAEHGVGFMIPKHIHFSRPPEAIEVMRQMKSLFDPNGILNPYKMIPSSS